MGVREEREGKGRNHREIGFGFKSNAGIERSTWPVGLGSGQGWRKAPGQRVGNKEDLVCAALGDD